MVSALQAVIDGREHPSLVRSSTPATARRLAYVFPGQGGQRPGMGRLFYESIPAFRAEVDRCAEEFATQFGESPLNYLLDEHLPADDDAGTVQPALFTQMAGLAAMWRSFGIAPKATIGHSQGEIAAAYVSGTITLADAVRVVGIRARAADEFASGDYAMAVVAADRDTCEDVLARCSGWAQLSVVNSPSMVGISGDRETVQDIVDTFTERGTFARVIRVQYPAHTSLINELAASGTRDHATRTAESEVPRHGYRLPRRHARRSGSRRTCRSTNIGSGTCATPFDSTRRFTAALPLGVDTFVELAEHPTLQLAIQDNLAVLSNEADERATLVVGTSDRTASDLGEFTRNLALLAVHDLDYSWECLRTESAGPTPLPLLDFPNTRMNETRLWLPYDQGPPQRAGHTSTVESVAAPTEPIRDPVAETTTPRLLAEEWVRLSHRSLVPPRAHRNR